MDLEHAVREMQDRVAIDELRSRYARTIDNRDWEGYASLFAEDAVVEYHGRGRFEGPAEVKQFVEENVAYDQSVHMAHMPTVTIDGDEATGSWYLYVFYVIDDTYGWVVGEYEDEYRRVDGEWKFTYISNENYFDTGGYHPTVLD